MGTTCSRVRCSAAAVCAPVALLYPPVNYQDAPPVRMAMSIGLCQKHADELDFCDADWRETFQKQAFPVLRSQHRVIPDLDRTKKELIAFDSPEYLQLQRDIQAARPG